MSPTQIATRPDWRLEIQRAYTKPELLLANLGLNPEQFQADCKARSLFPMRVPRPFAQLMQQGNRDDPLLLQVLPRTQEFDKTEGYTDDPLGEISDNVLTDEVGGLLHKYRSRVLLIVKGGCAVNCRYCFRRHFPYQEVRFSQHELQQTVNYLNRHPEVNEVILSGGDPLMASDAQLKSIVEQLASVTSLKRVRIHSRLPVVIPSRLTQQLKELLVSTRLKPILVIHANHGNELSDTLEQHLNDYNRAGILLLNQSVLLAGINDSSAALSRLSERLFDANVLPYYLHQLDKVSGAAHFEVSDQRAQQIWQEMNHALPGFLVPKLVRELAGEQSKTPIMPAGPVSIT